MALQGCIQQATQRPCVCDWRYSTDGKTGLAANEFSIGLAEIYSGLQPDFMQIDAAIAGAHDQHRSISCSIAAHFPEDQRIGDLPDVAI
jgi:hypothetical protein